MGNLFSSLRKRRQNYVPMQQKRALMLAFQTSMISAWCRNHSPIQSFPGGAVIKNQPANAGDTGDAGSIPGSRSLREGNGNPLQSSCLENPMGRAVWRAAVHRIAKSWTQLKWLSPHAYESQKCLADLSWWLRWVSHANKADTTKGLSCITVPSPGSLQIHSARASFSISGAGIQMWVFFIITPRWF